MKLSLAEKSSNVDVLFILMEKDGKLSPAAKSALGTAAKDAEARIKAKDFEGAEGSSLALYGDGKLFKRAYLVGTGEEEKHLPQAMEKLGGSIAGLTKGAKAKKIAILVESQHLADIAHGVVLGNYSFDRYKKKDKQAVELKQVEFINKVNAENKGVISNANVFAAASPLTRDLVNIPAGDLTTKDLANAAKTLGGEYGMKIKILNHVQLAKLGCGALVGVGQGAEEKSKLVFIEYKHKSKSKVPNIAFIGKGVVFDTGGLNLKPTGYMETMKQDMAGAATVLGAMQAIAEAKLSGHYLGVLSCAENAVSEGAQRPGDVVTAYNGKTIEITNTDAEGRLCLADAIAYTEKNYKPKVMIDIATLTGAVSVALGHHITGVMGNNKKLMKEVLASSEATHERSWELPLTEDFVKATKGEFTDLKNSTSGVRAGSSMGGAFLKNFVKDTPWAHFDIGGTAWADKPSSTTEYGATAAALRTFLELARRHQG
ncbi:MAG: leucyl aminopeptidase [Oceanicoccus sp.]|jgi:leucyl aminopeptidase